MRCYGYSPMGYATKQEAYFAWRDDYDKWKYDNFGIPWGYRDAAPQWEDYWCEVEYEPYDNIAQNANKDLSKDTDCNNNDNWGCLLVALLLFFIPGILLIWYFER